MPGCVIESDVFVPTSGNRGCSVTNYDYSHTEFDCPRHWADYVICDPYGEIRRPGCWHPDEISEVYDDRCYSTNICWR